MVSENGNISVRRSPKLAAVEIEGAKLLQLLDRFARHLTDSLSVVSLVHWGAHFSIEHVELMELALQDDFMSAEVKPTSEQKAEAEKRARFAKSEKERGSPCFTARH